VDKQPAAASLVTGRCGGLLTHSAGHRESP